MEVISFPNKLKMEIKYVGGALKIDQQGAGLVFILKTTKLRKFSMNIIIK